MSIVVTLLIGLVVGIIAKFLMPGKDPGGFIITTLLGSRVLWWPIGSVGHWAGIQRESQWVSWLR